LRIVITIEGGEVTVSVTPSPPPAEGQTTLADFTADGDEPSRHPTLEGEAQFFNHIPVRPNVDANEGVNAENRPERVGNQGYARTGTPNSCSRCGQVHRRCREIDEGFRCLTCEGWYDESTELHLHRRETGWFDHPRWADQYERLQNGA